MTSLHTFFKEMVHCISWWLYHNACVVLFCCVVLIDACIQIRLTTFTVDTSVSSTTFACISVHPINACSAVPTWITVAFDYVYDKQLHIWCMKVYIMQHVKNLYVADMIRWQLLVIYKDIMTNIFVTLIVFSLLCTLSSLKLNWIIQLYINTTWKWQQEFQ